MKTIQMKVETKAENPFTVKGYPKWKRMIPRYIGCRSFE
jgi:hypothetical protein